MLLTLNLKYSSILIIYKRASRASSKHDSFYAWEIPSKQIEIEQDAKIGSGAFSSVQRGKDFYHGLVAIKYLVLHDSQDQEHMRAFKHEVSMLKSVRHDNIVSFVGYLLHPKLAIVTEWCPGRSLYRHLHVEDKYWEMHQLIGIAKQIATGMEYLHARSIIHRDLKSANIFLMPKEAAESVYLTTSRADAINGLYHQSTTEIEEWQVKIGDFGLATAGSAKSGSNNNTKNKSKQPNGSILWMAPEVIVQKVEDPYTQKSDVYSYAVVLYELVSGQLPFLAVEHNSVTLSLSLHFYFGSSFKSKSIYSVQILFQVGSGRLKLDPNDSRTETPPEIKNLISICSDHDRKKRLDFIEVINFI